MLVYETWQSWEQQQELLELETENDRLLLNILPRHVVPFFVPPRRHARVCCLLFACVKPFKLCVLRGAHVIAQACHLCHASALMDFVVVFGCNV